MPLPAVPRRRRGRANPARWGTAPSSFQARAFSSSVASEMELSVQMTPTMAPVSRSLRVSARVSTSAMPITLCCLQKPSRSCSLRQLDTSGARLRTMMPSSHALPLSMSAAFMPVLPMCTLVKQTICPA